MPVTVEVAGLDDGSHAVRDSRTGPGAAVHPADWAAFAAGVRDGEFD